MTLICPRCMSAEVIRLDLDDGDKLTCQGCDESYTVTEVREMVDGWKQMLPWLLQCPAREPVDTEGVPL